MKMIRLIKIAKIVGSALAGGVLIAALFSCGNKGSGAASEEKPSLPTVRLITDKSGVDDKSFNQVAWEGILSFYGDTKEKESLRGKLYDVITCASQDMYIPILKQMSDDEPSLIITTGFTFAPSLEEVATSYPSQKYAIIDSGDVKKDNVACYLFKEEEGAYLVGALAALNAISEGVDDAQFGFIGALPGSTITKFEMGYIQGIRRVLPEARIIDYYANDWARPDLAKTQSKNWYSSGVYAIFSAAGATGSGTIAEAKEERSSGKNVWAIGVDNDQYEDGLYEEGKSAVLTSMVKMVDIATLDALHKVQEDTYTPGTTVLGLKEGGVGYSAKNSVLTSSILEEVEKLKKAIIEKEITVYPTYKEALEEGLVPQGLGAKDD